MTLERFDQLTEWERQSLAHHAASTAELMNDFRFNGQWQAGTADQIAELDTGEPTTKNMDAWQAKQDQRDAQQQRWRDISAALHAEPYSRLCDPSTES